MTNPDNVGGLPTADQLYDIAADAWDQHQTNCRVTTTAGSLRKAVEAIHRELCRAAPAGGDAQWRCFHCDEVFTTGEAAALHFGTREYQSPACQIDVAAYREMEALQLRYLDEDADVHRAMYRMQSEHKQALRRAEEDGYAKGVRDAEKDSTPAGSGEVEALASRLVSMSNGLHSAHLCTDLRRAAALLRKLQQGADGWRPIDSAPKDGSYVLVANSHGSWIARWHPVYQSGYRPSNPWMSMMLNHDHIEKPGRYDLPSQWRPIPHPAASQGQEGPK